MYPEVKAIWTKALRSAAYEQTGHTLTRIDKETGKLSHCCLGVLCEEAIKAGVVIEVSDMANGIRYYDSESSVLPDTVVEWAGLGEFETNPTLGKDDNGNWLSAAEANDSLGKTFAQIADMIDATFTEDE